MSDGQDMTLAKLFARVPTCLSLIGLDETDLAQLERRITVVEDLWNTLKDRCEPNCHRTRDNSFWFFQTRDDLLQVGGLDVMQSRTEIQILHPDQAGIKKFRLTVRTDLPAEDLTREGGVRILRSVLDAFRQVAKLPHGGLDGSPDMIRDSARHAAAVVGALHAVEGRGCPGTCSYLPRTPWREASLLKSRDDGRRPFLRKEASVTLMSDDPVAISLSGAEGWYEIDGKPNKETLPVVVPDAVEALRTLSVSRLRDGLDRALIPIKTNPS